MSLAPQDFFPGLAGWVATLDDVWPGVVIKPYFAQWEVGHLLAIALLGGASILVNLRLIGFGIVDEPPSEVNRNTRAWMHIGVIGVLVTGLLIGASNAERLYTSEAFTAKMLGLAAAIVLTYGVSMPLAKAEGRAGGAVRIAAVVGLALWALSLWVFGVGKLINPGLWHVITAAALIVLFVTRGLIRGVYLAGLGLLIVIQFVATHFVIPPDDFARLDPANKAFAWVFTAWILGMAGVQMFRGGGSEGGAFTKAMAYAAILVWVTTAAAGRWIAFA
ncbi:MAG: DUF6644 family protein [Pseudomonadota bacterium]|jgi:hypothetical protein